MAYDDWCCEWVQPASVETCVYIKVLCSFIEKGLLSFTSWKRTHQQSQQWRWQRSIAAFNLTHTHTHHTLGMEQPTEQFAFDVKWHGENIRVDVPKTESATIFDLKLAIEAITNVSHETQKLIGILPKGKVPSDDVSTPCMSR